MWTRETVRAWAERHLPRRFRSCHVSAAAERTLGHWAYGQGALQALRRFDLVTISTDVSVPHAPECNGRKGGNAWALVQDQDVMAERLREACDA